MLQSRQFQRLRNAFKKGVFEAPKLVSTKTLLLRHYSGVNKSARERIGRQNLSQKVPSKKGSLGVIFSPGNERENAHSKSANYWGKTLWRPLARTAPFVHFRGLWSSEPPKRGQKTGAAQTLSKNVHSIFDTFWKFLTFFALRENCRKVLRKYFWHFLTIFDVFFAVAPFRWPLLRSAEIWGYEMQVRSGLLAYDRGGALLLSLQKEAKRAPAALPRAAKSGKAGTKQHIRSQQRYENGKTSFCKPYIYCPHRNDYNLNSWQIKKCNCKCNFGKTNLLEFRDVIVLRVVFPRNCYISRELIRLGIKKWNCNCNLQKINSRKQKKLHVIILMTRVHCTHSQKNPRVRKIRVRNSGAGNGCANFMDAWKKCVLSAGKPMSIKFLVLGGGGILV